jgi:hypothetical protein
VNVKRRKRKTYLNEGNESFIDSLSSYIGQTITIFTISGGESGAGFTGVLLNISKDFIKLLTEPSSPPISSFEDNCLEGDNVDVSLGTLTDIPLDKIAAFIHNII